MEKLQLVSSAPPRELAQDLADKLRCSLDEAFLVLSPLPSPTPREEPWLPGLAPDGGLIQ